MNQKNKKTIDDQLADFTDNILNEKKSEVDERSNNPELHALEETALRLKNAFHDEGPSQEVIQRMRKNIYLRWQQQENEQRKSFWKRWWPEGQKWRSQYTRRNQAILSYLAIICGLLIISILLFNGVFSEQPASSGKNLNFGLLVASGALSILLALIYRRKQ